MWSRRPLDNWKARRLDAGETWQTEACLGFGAPGWLHGLGAGLRSKAGLQRSCSAWRRLLSPLRDRHDRLWGWGARGTCCGVWRARPGDLGPAPRAREAPGGPPAAVGRPRPGFPGALAKMEPAVRRRRGGEARGEEGGRGMRGRAGNRLQRGV